MEKKITLLYDSECTLCVRFKKALEILDNQDRMHYRSIYETAVYFDFPELNQAECEEVVHLIDSEGKIYRGSEVIEFLIKQFPGVKKFSWLLESDSAKKAMDVFYDQINDMRIMKKRKCFRCGKSHKKKSL